MLLFSTSPNSSIFSSSASSFFSFSQRQSLLFSVHIFFFSWDPKSLVFLCRNNNHLLFAASSWSSGVRWKHVCDCWGGRRSKSTDQPSVFVTVTCLLQSRNTCCQWSPVVWGSVISALGPISILWRPIQLVLSRGPGATTPHQSHTVCVCWGG